jgi:hypothetical protein
MIENLLARIIVDLRQALAGVMAQPDTHIVAGPVADPAAAALPVVALSPGELTIKVLAGDSASSQPRPQEFREELAINNASPLGPYALARTPLTTSALCKLVLDQGTLDERQVLLIEGADFSVDYQNARITLAHAVTGASTLLVRYSYVGVFTVQDFSQKFSVDIYDKDFAAVEKWAALANSVILTSRDDLLNFYNQTSPTTYTAGAYASTHMISQLQALGGVPALATAGVKLQFMFNVNGQLKLTKEIGPDFGLIQHIRSPGRSTVAPVDIDIGLE